MSMAWVAVGTAVVGAGASAYSANKNKPKAVKPGEVDYERDIKSFVAGLKGSMPSVLGMEKRYRDDFTGLNLGDVYDMLGGTKKNKGLFELGGKYSKRASNQIDDARTRELAQMRGQTAGVRGLFQSLSPEAARMVSFANQDAITAQRNAQGLTGGEARSAQQFAREGAADRGRVMDNSAMAAEILNRDNILGQKRQEAYGATQNAFNMASAFYTQPGLQSLNSMPNSYQAGQGYLNLGLGAIGSARPQMVDIGAGLNLGAANRQNYNSAQMANAQMAASQNAANTKMYSDLTTSLIGAYSQ
jgi:hypothetical protein